MGPSTCFKYPLGVSRLIYTPNAIEGFNRQLRKVPKAKSVFPTDKSLLKLLYLAVMDITKKIDRTATGPEPNPRPTDYLFRRAYARVTPDIKGFVSGLRHPLTSISNGVVMQTGRQPIKFAPALNKFRSLRTSNDVYTKIGLTRFYVSFTFK